MTNDEEVIKEAEALLQGAFTGIRAEVRKEHINSMPFITNAFLELIKNSENSDKRVHIGFIVPDEILDPTAPHIANEHIDALKARPQDFVSAKMKLFYSFDNESNAIKCLEIKDAQLVAHEINPEDTALFIYVKKKDHGIAALVAGHCICVQRTHEQETITEHAYMGENDKEHADKFFAPLAIDERTEKLIRQAIEFHEAPILFAKEYPESYAEVVSNLKKKLLDELDDTED
jgi:hypothetical protein